jgi:S-adenosyl-L-methionine hydrolase (adenosine-forming)
MTRPVISITTDFGTGDYDAGVLSGVILSIVPEARISVLTHDVTPFNILEGAVILSRCTSFFPEDSIHVAVVDPGVGTARRGLAARLGRQIFVGPDNGLCTLMVEAARNEDLPVEFYSLDNSQYWLPNVTHIFHGRDIFASVAAHIAAGIPLKALGAPIVDPVLLKLPVPTRTVNGWHGTLLHVDHFGNLTSNLTAAHLDGRTNFTVQILGSGITNLTHTYGAAQPGSLICLLDDSDCLEIAVSQGSAENRLKAGVGTEFDLVFQE